MSDAITLFVPGHPASKGSGLGTRKQRENRRRADWEERVELALRRVGPRYLWSGPVEVASVFRLPQPKGRVFNEIGAMLLPPDLDKLLRCILDAATGLIYQDDAQVVAAPALKRWARDGYPMGAALRFRELSAYEAIAEPEWAEDAVDVLREAGDE